MGKLLYTPSEKYLENAYITQFTKFFSDHIGKPLHDYNDLFTASLAHKEQFWDCLRRFTHVIGEFDESLYIKGNHIKEDRYFPNARLNYAENLLAPFKDDEQDMLIFSSEGQNHRRLNAKIVKNHVAALSSYLEDIGLNSGNRIAAVMPNMPETVTLMLATTACGGVWASCSPDFGTESIIDRFGQIAPKALIICDQYRYNGKMIDMSDKITALQKQLPDIEHFIVVPFLEELSEKVTVTNKIANYHHIIEQNQGTILQFERVPFNAPLFIMFSSGTTGAPKCIVHSVGGTLLQHLKEHRLHCNLGHGDKFFYYTTCGWMMWNWMVSALASGMPLILYDGSPFAPSERVLFDLLEEENATILGTSAKYIDAIRKSGFIPKEHYKLDTLRIVTSTGSPLSEESFDFVYDSVKSDLQLASISGGTDIVSCFVLGAPNLPVYSGEIGCRGLAMDVDIFDENGQPLKQGKGEMVCKSSFPSMPIYFWNDPDGQRYHNAYFSSVDGVWAHGDFAEFTEHGGIIIHGRSDTVLNPGGVRIGTAEIYRQVEKFDEVSEAVCIGQKWEDDVRVVLFLKLQDNIDLSEELIKKIKTEIRQGTSPRHVPSIIKSVPDIPRTKSGKITETAVRDIVHGLSIRNTGSLANPEALEYYKDII